MRSNKQIDKLNQELAGIAGKISSEYKKRNEAELNNIPNKKEIVSEAEKNILSLRKEKKELEAKITKLRTELENDLFWV
ncbi:hypothetical protein ABE29_22615 [Cytobacillus firmus]|uniref:hypothetical protein n=1 Tax=Cytobacillus firmus TaxID=1399 RepID=UPI00077C416B|nr:hypothetical protein [Cytobacillus firmus]MBG9545446.1 hypothetical protein [Cytobacillus firmus]MBG9554525.1 hypothetical protein [Cytobacillus firmus]MBG9555387.1 hypothetical protein [Cytobacillus firmus]MBG9576148.1 hypothetical protein [Cytobacillus firmus]MEC1894803.1 hypothetical protein [Cytobacillus firmus]